jgi:hypothetical protein
MQEDIFLGLRFWNAKRAQKFGKPLEPSDMAVLLISNPLIHCEFQFSKSYARISFSSTLKKGAKGCRFLQIEYSHPERWDTLWLPVTPEQEDAAYVKAQELEGKKYGFAELFGLPEPDKYCCSKAIAEVIKAAKKYSDDFRTNKMTPLDLFFEMFYRLSAIE